MDDDEHALLAVDLHIEGPFADDGLGTSAFLAMDAMVSPSMRSLRIS